MGDDTWLTVFPTAFHPEMTHDFDSFNVEDLHTVDNGVIANLFPLLTNSTHAHSWDFLIGHFLGVDHVGHRVGPDHPTMLAKQQQMNDVLKRVVDALDEDTLLIVLGDHGMDRKGDHGGDGDLEVSAGLWIYSKGPTLSSEKPPTSQLPHKTFPGEPSPHRSVQQIDLVPTLSLLLGLPIPFNNLGTVIPELFWRDRVGSDYAKALDINVRQVHSYLDAYRNSSSGAELDGVWRALEASWTTFYASKSKDIPETAVHFTRLALETCRSLWARFNAVLMVGGLVVITLSLLVGWAAYGRSRSIPEWDLWLASLGRAIALSSGVGAALGVVIYTLFRNVYLFHGVTIYQAILFGASVSSGIRILASAPPPRPLRPSWTAPILLLHSIAFLSNSYTFWEDRAVPFFLLFTLAPPLLAALSAPPTDRRLRRRILAFAALFAVCVRLMAVSTVCREEQHPWCSVTFFSGSGAAEPPPLVRVLLVPVAALLPRAVIRRVLATSKSDNGIAALVLPYLLPTALVAGSACWLLEWLDASGGAYANLRTARTVVAWTSVVAVLVGTLLWALVPVALHVSTQKTEKKTEVRVLGFANAFGAPFVVLWALALAPVWLAAQPSAQITLALATAAVLAHLELVDAVRDARALRAASSFVTDPSAALARLQLQQQQQQPGTQGTTAVRFDEIVPLALLAQLAFFASGHQATLASLQWKSAFVLTPTASYTLAPILVVLNTFGPTVLVALAAPLLGLWNVAPLASSPSSPPPPPPAPPVPASSASDGDAEETTPPPSQARTATLGATRAALGITQYFATLLLGSALSAAWLRRHLMVWKVFAPRYMLGAFELLLVDAVVLGVGMWFGVGRVVRRVGPMFELPSIQSPGAAGVSGGVSSKQQKQQKSPVR